jgi:subtilisin family serine protease
MKKFLLVASLFLSFFSNSRAQFIEMPSSGSYDLILVFNSSVSTSAIERLKVELNAVDLGVTTPITKARVWRKRGPAGSTGIPSASYSISEASDAVDRVRGGTTSVGGGALVEINMPTQTPEGGFNLQNAGQQPTNPPLASACKMASDYQFNATDIGSSTVRVAILDTGLECKEGTIPTFTHPYLRSFVDATSSRSFSMNSWVNDKHGHGTAVASIIVRTFYGTAGAGICKIIPIKVLDNEGKGNLFNLIRGIDHAIEKNVDIINISIVSPDKTSYGKETPIQLALKNAASRNILVVSAAGNDGSNIDETENTVNPACAQSDNQIVVGAAKCADGKAEFSNYGKGTVDVFAPGIDIAVAQLTWREGGGFRWGDGTSFAAPIVTGMAAVLRSKLTTRNYKTLKCAILNGANRIPAFTPYCKTGAVINVPRTREKFVTCPR